MEQKRKTEPEISDTGVGGLGRFAKKLEEKAAQRNAELGQGSRGQTEQRGESKIDERLRGEVREEFETDFNRLEEKISEQLKQSEQHSAGAGALCNHLIKQIEDIIIYFWYGLVEDLSKQDPLGKLLQDFNNAVSCVSSALQPVSREDAVMSSRELEKREGVSVLRELLGDNSPLFKEVCGILEHHRLVQDAQENIRLLDRLVNNCKTLPAEKKRDNKRVKRGKR